MVYRSGVAMKVLLKGLASFSFIVNAADLFSVSACLKRLSKLFCQTGRLSEMFFQGLFYFVFSNVSRKKRILCR